MTGGNPRLVSSTLQIAGPGIMFPSASPGGAQNDTAFPSPPESITPTASVVRARAEVAADLEKRTPLQPAAVLDGDIIKNEENIFSL